ncbi:bifunctional DNA primase/polymerase [Streptomyces sp. NRRL WC-3626]|uniref:bifunctional DNA primase/polymerase n=1 Tax=Streptomyces sp. NRRL WC-3626 TaxID=1463926 RepID=UPI0004C0BB67|nr:bifunctional DNA primase/polymerase [Streptomyces sp. NRRL WC-3626]
MSAEFGGRSGRQGRLSQWLRGRRPKPPADEGGREALLLAAADAGLPLAPAAHPAARYGCSCDRVGCPTPARHPVSFAWQTQSTTDHGQIERWARHQPQANFITATGMVHDVLDVPLDAGRQALTRLLATGIEVGPVAESDDDRMLFFTLTRGTPEDEDEWWPCELDCHPETMDEHPGLRWHCRGSYVLVPPARLPGDDGRSVRWVRGPEHPLPDPLSLLELLTDSCARYAEERPDHASAAWPSRH